MLEYHFECLQVLIGASYESETKTEVVRQYPLRDFPCAACLAFAVVSLPLGAITSSFWIKPSIARSYSPAVLPIL